MGTLTPAYGRDYKSKKEALEAFDAGQDFIYNSIDGQNYCAKQELITNGIRSVQLRYKNNTQVIVIKLF